MSGKLVSRVSDLKAYLTCQIDIGENMCHITISFISVDTTKEMLGTFSPQQEPYTFDAPEETTPSGYFARGSYTAKSKVSDYP